MRQGTTPMWLLLLDDGVFFADPMGKIIAVSIEGSARKKEGTEEWINASGEVVAVSKELYNELADKHEAFLDKQGGDVEERFSGVEKAVDLALLNDMDERLKAVEEMLDGYRKDS